MQGAEVRHLLVQDGAGPDRHPLQPRPAAPRHADLDSALLAGPVASIMSQGPVSVAPETPLIDGGAAAARERIGALPVRQGDQIVGIFTIARRARGAPRDRAGLGRMSGRSLAPFLDPSSVAVIGASRDPDKVGGSVLANLRAAGFAGRIIPINAHADMVQGIRSAPLDPRRRGTGGPRRDHRARSGGAARAQGVRRQGRRPARW